jgi:hypothetical protein
MALAALTVIGLRFVGYERPAAGSGLRGLRRLENGQYPFSNPGRNRLQSRDQIGQKAAEVAVAFIER